MYRKVVALGGAVALMGCALSGCGLNASALNPAKLLPGGKPAKDPVADAKAVVSPAPARKELETAFWTADGQAALAKAQKPVAVQTHAKNVILFVGDGMGVSTITAARILAAQQAAEAAKAKDVNGEDAVLSFEQFPATALAKTYNLDLQTPDSAGAMSAILTGVKTRGTSVALGPKPTRGQCQEAAGQETSTLLEQAKAKGLATGLVTTSRITFAAPAAAYAHLSDSDWEVDAVMPPAALAQKCQDIARQLAGSQGALDIVLGGGRLAFLPRGAADPDAKDRFSARAGDEDLIALWLRNNGGRYITTGSQLRSIHWDVYRGPLLGLFSPDNMAYEADRAGQGLDEPSLTEMTGAAIKALQRNPRGYVLVVDAGGIDRAHHETNAYHALTDAAELARAVQAAADLTNADDTLIVVTADHSQTLTMGGYAKRGAPILGLAEGLEGPLLDTAGHPYTTLAYAAGPVQPKAPLTAAEVQAPGYRQAAGTPLAAAPHGGEDAPVYARGPGAQWVHGVLDQNALYAILHMAILGPVKDEPRRIAGVPLKLPTVPLPFLGKKDDKK